VLIRRRSAGTASSLQSPRGRGREGEERGGEEGRGGERGSRRRGKEKAAGGGGAERASERAGGKGGACGRGWGRNDARWECGNCCRPRSPASISSLHSWWMQMEMQKFAGDGMRKHLTPAKVLHRCDSVLFYSFGKKRKPVIV
jgi:hypothetical protein